MMADRKIEVLSPMPWCGDQVGRGNERRYHNPPDHLASRALDIFVSVILLIFLAPVFIIIALAVKVTDPGPIIFAHRRIGYRGKEFFCLKFRSMYVHGEDRLREILDSDAELAREWQISQKLTNDPRVTPLGRFLRVSSLDELPQLVNVLIGEMSLVGPRPIVMAEAERYGRFFWHYAEVKPGLTGLWQISGRSDCSYRRRIAADIYYCRSKSLVFDLKVMVATIPAVLLARGAG